MINMEEMCDYVQKLDTKEPGIFVFKLKKRIPNAMFMRTADDLDKAIRNYSPNSQVILLNDIFDVIKQPDEEIMDKIGWVRKTT